MALNANISLNAILNTATSALQANQTALRITSNNIANVNTEGYHRRVVDFGPRLTAERLTGVTIEDIRRISDEYLGREYSDATSSVGRAEVLASYFDRIQDFIGSLDAGSSLDARISQAMTALQQLSVDPASIARRNSALSAVTSALSAISSMAGNVQMLRQDANTQITTDVRAVNSLIANIYDLNNEIKSAIARNDTQTGLLDQRDRAIAELSKYMDIRTFEQGDGRIYVSLGDGTGLITDVSSELRYAGPSAVNTATSFPPLTLQRFNPEGGNDLGPAIALESRIRGGELRGLLDMRDRELPDLAEQLGQVSSALVEQLNAIHNNSSSVPPANSLTGINTGLSAADALNFAGDVRFAVVDATGALVQQVNINTTGLTTVNDLVNAINAGLGGNATASFANGVLSISAANSAHGVAVLQDPTNPALRGGRGLSQFFGLNNLVTASSPSNFATGVTMPDQHNFALGGVADFVLRGTNGQILTNFSVTVGGAAVSDLVNDLNTAASGYATFSLDADGRLTMTPAGAFAGARLEVKNDTTDRAGTGVSMTQFFGMGTAMRQNQAMSLSVRSDIASNSSRLSLAQLDLDGTSVAGDIVLGASDNTGALALAGAANSLFGFQSAGRMTGGSLSLNDYVSQLMSLQSDLTNAAEYDRVSYVDVQEEVSARRSAIEGVNLDEELSNMMIFQQAYNASARIMTVAQEMFDTLIEVV